MTLKEAKQYTGWLGMLGILGLSLAQLLTLLPIGRDDTDGAWPRRSGLIIRQDDLTQCQYLESTQGHLIPRMDVDGKQMGCAGSIVRPGQVRKTWPGIDAPRS